MPTKKAKKASSQYPTLFGFLFESKAAALLIFLNAAIYFLLQTNEKAREMFGLFTLYPGNLMRGHVWCLVTSGFIHGSLSHLSLNMLGVFIFARVVERKLGAKKTLFLYLGAMALSMMIATLIYVFLLQRMVAIIGASGAVMGLIAAAMLLDPFAITYEMLLPIPTMFKAWLFFYADLKGFLGGERDGVSHLAHLIGFVSIGMLFYFLSKEDKKLMRKGLIINIVSFFLFLVLKYKLKCWL